MRYWQKFAIIVAACFLTAVKSGDECQPATWKKRAVGDIICRYYLESPEQVNYYTCSQLALKFDITVEKFFELNPDMDKDCTKVKPLTRYCVKGC